MCCRVFQGCRAVGYYTSGTSEKVDEQHSDNESSDVPPSPHGCSGLMTANTDEMSEMEPRLTPNTRTADIILLELHPEWKKKWTARRGRNAKTTKSNLTYFIFFQMNTYQLF